MSIASKLFEEQNIKILIESFFTSPQIAPAFA